MSLIVGLQISDMELTFDGHVADIQLALSWHWADTWLTGIFLTNAGHVADILTVIVVMWRIFGWGLTEKCH
jgi:hypothetical protein